MVFDFTSMVHLIYEPGKAFRNLNKKATEMEGVAIALIAAMAVYLMTLAMDTPFDATALTVALFMGLAGLLIPGAFTAHIAGIMGGKRNVEKTIALFGYANIMFVIFTLIGYGMFLVLGDSLPATIITEAGITQFFTAVFLPMIVVGIVLFIWSLWVYGKAAAEANKISFGKAVLALLMADMIYLILLVPLSMFIPIA